MITTSEKYKEVLKYPLRPRSHIKVTFNNSNNDFEGSSYRADAINGVSMPNKMRGFYFHNETCYAFLSKDFMRTDGSQIVLPADSSKRYDVGYISSALSASTASTDTDENGNTITGYAVTNDTSEYNLQIDCVNFYHYAGMNKLSITFDKNQNTHPMLIEVNGGREEQIVVFTRKVACTSNEFVYIGGANDTPSNYVYSINFKMLNNPQSRIHITRIVLGDTVVFDDSKITSASLTKNVSITSNELSYHDFSMTVNNYDQEYNPVNPTGIFRYMNSNLKFVVEMGRDLTMNDGEDTEWLTVASLYTDGQPAFDKDSYTIHGVDSLSVLTDKGYMNKSYYQKNFSTTYSNYTIDQEIYSLFNSSRKSAILLNFNPFPAIFTTSKIKNAVPLDSINNQFQLIANYLKEVVFSDKDGRITFKDAVIPFITASDNGRMYYSNSNDVINSTKLPTNIYTNLHKDYMSTSYNSNQLVPPLSQQPIKGIGFISQNVSDSSGNIADVTFTVNYSMAFEQTSFIITFNSVDKEYAVAFTVNFYNQDVLVGTITETNNTLVNYSKTIDFNADKIVINITKWSKPSRFAVINQINSGRILNYIIDFNDMKEYPSIENIKQTAIVNSKYHTITESDSQEDLATISFYNDTNGKYYQISKNIYGNPANTTIQVPSGTAGQSTCSFANQNSLYIHVMGIPSSQYSCVYKATTANDTEAEASVTYNSSGDVITYDNALCESNTKATELANWYYDYVKKGQKFTISYRGDPAIEPFDFIYIQSQFEDEYVPVVVTKTTLDFDGGISGKIECIRV